MANLGIPKYLRKLAFGLAKGSRMQTAGSIQFFRSLLELEMVMSFPREHLEFAIWFLRDKEFIRTGDISDYYISAAGAEYLESEVPSKGVLSKLLHGPRPSDSGAPATEYNATAGERVYAVALARTQ
jgi:hypothetical protein